MTRAIALGVATVAVVAVTWWWLGRPVAVPPVAADPGRIQCVSYAPFRGNDSPLDETTKVSARDVEEDLTRLARLTDCVRTYSNENGLDQVPAIAGRLGIKVIQGLWLGSDRKKNRARIDATVALARQYRDTISAIVVGNEVLLRGELASNEIADVLREVKASTGIPVTYADVWEFWLRNRDLAEAVDFITIHILPYWEDFPIAAEQAGAHVDSIRGRVAATFPGKEILIGEVGWPSAGRMREGALPSPANQARVLEEVMARARTNHYRVNLIEAFDQPWKRKLEGTVGGYWGLLTSGGRDPKFAWGEPVSNHPSWVWQGAAGIALAAAVFVAAFGGRGEKRPDPPSPILAGVTIAALAGGITAPWTVAVAATESLGVGGWVRGLAFIAVSFGAPVAVAMTLSRGVAVPAFARVLGRPTQRPGSALAMTAGVILVVVTVLALQTALGLVFDPRYHDFAFAQLTAAVVPFAVASVIGVRGRSRLGRAELLGAVTLLASAVYIILDEGVVNWQAVWLTALLAILAITLFRLRDAQSS